MMKLNSTVCFAALTAGLLIFSTNAIAGSGQKGHSHGQGHSMAAEKPGAHSAHQGGHHGGGHHAAMNTAVGEKGDPAAVTRTLHITMLDNSYTPKTITVSKGETVRFIIENKGELVHEFNIGSAEMHKGHQAEMMAMMDSGALEADRIVHAKMGAMMHDDPNSALLEPGQKGEVIWKFGDAGEIQFACNVPGHYDAGMHGKLMVR